MKIITNKKKSDDKFLRTAVSPLDFDLEDNKKLQQLIRDMRKTMRKVHGVGLSANQVGVSKRLFIAEVPNKEGQKKFYTVINPKIVKTSEEKSSLTEGCLSIPKWFGDVLRPRNITLSGLSPYGKKLKIKAWGLLARVFQHEIDHLNGELFIDKAKNLHKEEEPSKDSPVV
ncbi:peptide deformylase [bacterium]|nr:peptide deformylase [bacterium]|tara:strand:- start:6813 stop:7325 length:513 start_codon:yes stop_codon:yes gene_type:complete